MKKGALSTTREFHWMYVIFHLHTSISFLCGLYLAFYDGYLSTAIFSLFLVLLSVLGLTAGCHRLWAHNSYRASTPLKIFLMLCHTLSGQGCIYQWVRTHRLNHKFYRTTLDPYDPSKGFLYTHFVESSLKLSEAQERELNEIDMSDLDNDKVVMFQKRYYWVLFVVITLLLPLNAPMEYWDEGILCSVFIVGWLRWWLTYHLSLLIYSGYAIFDLNSDEREAFDSNLVFLVNKSHWLSYHHLVPWDYQPSEYGKYGTDCTSKFIRVCAALELATDLKTTDNEVVKKALEMSAEESKPVSDCLVIVSNSSNCLIKDHFLAPSKFY